MTNAYANSSALWEQRLYFIRAENGIFFTFPCEYTQGMQLKYQMATERENLEPAAKMRLNTSN